MARGLLLINLGTPSSTRFSDVGRYLLRFLMDRRVIDLPALLRFLLVCCVIVPFRTRKSAKAYELIWTSKGSPLLYLSQNLRAKLQSQVGSACSVALAMRYSQPSIQLALEQLADCTSITVLPLYPQYSSAATGSPIEELLYLVKHKEVIPSLNLITQFYEHPSYIRAQAHLIKPFLHEKSHLLLSYHGIPQRQIEKAGCRNACSTPCQKPASGSSCYRAQCFQTSRLVAQELGLGASQYTTAFQSRLGAIPWVKPYTDEVLVSLADGGVQHLVVACPSFVTDCLETLEEIGIRAKEQWLDLGGSELTLVPCLNDHPVWIEALLDITQLRNPS
jgi:ferrochelatase